MTMPNGGFVPGGVPQIQGGNSGYVQVGGGYNQATAQANGQPGQQQVQVHPMQAQTQLGGQVAQNLPAGMLGSDGVSPLSQVQPHVSQQGLRQPIQQQQPSAQYNPNQPYQYNTPGQQQQQQVVDPLQQPIFDPRLPPELQGKTVAQLALMNQGLRQLHLQNSTQQQRPPEVVPSHSTQQTTQQSGPPGQQGAPTQFNWQRPDEFIGRIVEEKLGGLESRIGAMIQPVVASGHMTQANVARNTVAGEVQNFAQIEPMVLQRLQGLSPAQIADPETWRIATRIAIGDLALAGQAQAQRGQFQHQVPQYNGVFPQQQVQQGGQPVPNYNGFSGFTEQPNQGGPGPVGGAQLNPAQRNAAAAMGMSEADYMAWGQGVPTQNPGARR